MNSQATNPEALAIPNSMNRLEKSVSSLQDVFSSLKSRLVPVLRPSPEDCPETSSGKDRVTGTLSTGISGVADHIDNLTTHIEMLLQELEI